MPELTDNIGQLIDRGGIVMVPLIAISVISLALIVERTWFWVSTNRPTRVRRVLKVIRLLAKRDANARRVLMTDQSVYGLVYRDIVDAESSDAAAIAAVEAHRPRMERFMTALSTIITAAPLLGILGTVLGIIRSFQLLGDDQILADPRGISAGIAEALLTTAVGLVVALFTLFPYMIFRKQIDRTLGRLEAIIAAASESVRRGGPETEAARTRTTED